MELTSFGIGNVHEYISLPVGNVYVQVTVEPD